MLRNIAAIVLLVSVISGCASTISGIQETYQSVSISLDNAHDEVYRLYSSSDKHFFGAGKAQNGTITFSLEDVPWSNTCLVVVDKSGEPVRVAGGGRDGFQLKLPATHYGLIQKQRDLAQLRSRLESEYSAARNDQDAVDRDLTSNRANVDGQCIEPEMLTLPEPIKERCRDGNLCHQDATQICFAVAFGAEGCGQALAEHGVPGVVSGPTCGKAAATLAETEYDMGNAIADAIQGSIDDWANRQIKEGGIFEMIVGTLTKGLGYAAKLESAKSCTEQFMNRYYWAWVREVERVQKEPIESLNQCHELFRKRDALNLKIRELVAYDQKSRSESALNAQQISNLENARQFVSAGCQ